MIPHRVRPTFPARFPQHVTIKVQADVVGMRNRRCFSELARVMWLGSSKEFGFRLLRFAVMGNHIHMLVEAVGKEALSKGMHALNIRIARALNRLQGRRGRVLVDHYHARILKTPTDTKNAHEYLMTNAERHHYRSAGDGADPFVSPLLHVPRTWLLVTVERAMRRSQR